MAGKGSIGWKGGNCRSRYDKRDRQSALKERLCLFLHISGIGLSGVGVDSNKGSSGNGREKQDD